MGAIKKVVAFIDELRHEGIDIEYLDIGGGLGIIYKNEIPQTAQALCRSCVAYIREDGLEDHHGAGAFHCR